MRRILTLAISCLFTGLAHAQTQPATPSLPAKEKFHLYLLMGQSNMVGRDRTGMDSQQENPRILSLNPEGQWIIAKDPLHPKVGAIECGVGPGLTFAAEMLKNETDPKVTIGLIPCAVGGTPLKRWVKSGDLYKAAIEHAKTASKDGVIVGMIWHQGESDTEKPETADTYGTRLEGMLKDLRKDLRQPELPIVVGQLGDFLSLSPQKFPGADTVKAAIKKIPDTVPHTGFADSAGLGHKGDKLHFNTEAQRDFGIRFAQAMKDLQKTTKKKP